MEPIQKKKQTKKKPAEKAGDFLAVDLGNHPYFVKKAAESKAFLDKYGFPKELIPKK